ncbi:MAG: HAD family phosphatase [Bacteroidia bacterium]|nr:HAD family phosphatase [Bacteroidia bacterium]
MAVVLTGCELAVQRQSHGKYAGDVGAIEKFYNHFLCKKKQYMIEDILNNEAINKHLLIFDLDGTLINTDDVNYLAYKEAIQKVKNLDLALLHKNDERFTREELYLIIEDLTSQEYENIIEIKNDVYKKYLKKSKVNMFVVKIIEKFSQSNKIVLATNSHRNRAQIILRYHSLTNLFDHIFCKEDYKNQKNNKFKHVLNNLNIDPNLAIVFENDNKEIKKAILSGIPDKNIVTFNNKDKEYE